MTVSGDYISADNPEFETGPNYPTVFGIKMTPAAMGVAAAILGAAAAAYLWTSLLQPTLQRTQELSADIQAKEQQLENQADAQQQIEDARTRLVEAERLRADVLSLFASEENIDTLLLDVNERVQAANAGITDPDRRATLSSFQSTGAEPEIINDSSLGQEVNGKLQRRVYTVSMEGSFAQTQSIVRSIERLQPLLVLRDFNSQLIEDTRALRVDSQGNPLAANQQPTPRLETTFQLDALMPAPQQAPAPAPAPEASPSP